MVESACCFLSYHSVGYAGRLDPLMLPVEVVESSRDDQDHVVCPSRGAGPMVTFPGANDRRPLVTPILEKAPIAVPSQAAPAHFVENGRHSSCDLKPPFTALLYLSIW